MMASFDTGISVWGFVSDSSLESESRTGGSLTILSSYPHPGSEHRGATPVRKGECHNLSRGLRGLEGGMDHDSPTGNRRGDPTIVFSGSPLSPKRVEESPLFPGGVSLAVTSAYSSSVSWETWR